VPVVSAHFRSLLFTNVSCVKTAEATDMSFGVWTARPSNKQRFRWKPRSPGRSEYFGVILAYAKTENARHENTGRSKMQDLKMRDRNLRHQLARAENAGKVSMESQSVKKCLKVVVFVCRVIHSV